LFLLNKKTQNHVNGLGSGSMFFFLKKNKKNKTKRLGCQITEIRQGNNENPIQSHQSS
jgi:hypothetical protein